MIVSNHLMMKPLNVSKESGIFNQTIMTFMSLLNLHKQLLMDKEQ